MHFKLVSEEQHNQLRIHKEMMEVTPDFILLVQSAAAVVVLMAA